MLAPHVFDNSEDRNFSYFFMKLRSEMDSACEKGYIYINLREKNHFEASMMWEKRKPEKWSNWDKFENSDKIEKCFSSFLIIFQSEFFHGSGRIYWFEQFFENNNDLDDNFFRNSLFYVTRVGYDSELTRFPSWFSSFSNYFFIFIPILVLITVYT